jgi:hypothetical protein
MSDACVAGDQVDKPAGDRAIVLLTWGEQELSVGLASRRQRESWSRIRRESDLGKRLRLAAVVVDDVHLEFAD